MDDKRYQVFVSSTFADLEDERRRVIQTLMEMDCIPAGMELFPAIDEEQWEFIKKVIDDCDYYLLIIGGRYGSVAEDGLSYTEKEFDYAVSKGLKVTVLLHEDPNSLPAIKTEMNPESREKLLRFIEKAQTGRLRKTWKSAQDLPGLVALSMSRTIKTHPAIGWVRANKISNESDLRAMIDLQKENERLRNELEQKNLTGTFNLPEKVAGLDTQFTIHYRLYPLNIMEINYQTGSITKSFSDIFSYISPLIFKTAVEKTIKNKVNEYLKSCVNRPSNRITIEDDDLQILILQYMALGLIEVDSEIFRLTQLGINRMMSLKLVME